MGIAIVTSAPAAISAVSGQGRLFLSGARASGVCVIGVGNRDRGDDGIGPRVAEQVAASGWDGVHTAVLDSADGTFLLSAWDGTACVYIVDAVMANLTPGTIVRFTGEQLKRGGGIRTLSTHGIGLLEAVEIGRSLGMLPDRLTIYGIAAGTFAPGDRITPAVESAGRRVMARIRRSIGRRVPRDA
jgi:hydrogenase maturation protease